MTMKNIAVSVITAVLTLFVGVPVVQAVRPSPKARRQKPKSAIAPQAEKRQALPKKPSNPLPPLVKIPASQPFFQPQHRLAGIGLDRQTMTDDVLEARTKNVILAQTFSIMRDPRATSWAAACSERSLQALFVAATEGVDFPKSKLEAIAFVESGCDPNARSPSGPSGIMQISGGTAKLMGLRKYYETRERVVPAQRKLIRKAKPGHPAVYKDVPAKKEKYKVLVDERFDPEKAIPAAAKYLARLAKQCGGVDFAIWAYHSGEGRVGDVRSLVKKYGMGDVTVPAVFFGNTLAWRPKLYELIQKDMARDFGPTYYFCVRRAEELLMLYRSDPGAYKVLAARYVNKVRPDRRAPHRFYVWYSPKDMFLDREAMERASGSQLVSVPQWPGFFSYVLRTSGAEAIGEKDPEHRQVFLQDPPEVVGTLEYVAFATRRLWEATHPKGEKEFVALEINALVRNVAYQKLLEQSNPNSHTDFPTHCIGAVDISYLRLPAWEKKCLEFVIQDMGWDEYLGYFFESKARQTIHIGTAPAHRDFFIRVYQEALASYSARK